MTCVSVFFDLRQRGEESAKMICRKTYRKYLLVLLGLSLLVLGVYDYFRERALIPDSYTQTEGGAGPETPGFPVAAQIQESVTKASYDSRN